MLRNATWLWSAVLVLLATTGGCQFFGQRSGVSTAYNLPLTVHVRLDDTIRQAAVEYRNACGRPVALPIAEPLEREIRKRMSQVFERVSFEGAEGGPPDGVVEAVLGLRETNLFVPRKANKTYPATLTLGLDFSYTETHGTVLHRKKLQSSSAGEVEAHADSCDLTGLDRVAEDTIRILVEGMAQQLGTSTRIREQAEMKKAGRPYSAKSTAEGAAATSEPAAVPLSEPVMNTPPAIVAPPAATANETPAAAAVSTKLSFRTILRDDNQNHILEQQEPFTVEFEVKNEGSAVAEGVEIDLAGHAAITGGIKAPIVVGPLQPGEIRRVAVDGKVGAVSEPEQAELICTLRASANVELPSAKKFFIAVRPDRSDAAEVLSVDVDQLPKSNGKSLHPSAVGIAIGIGAFRDSTVPPVKFAAHDAEVMGGYFRTLLGIPATKVKVVTDEQGLKDDLAELFEQWLPKQGGAHQTAYVYVSGRAVVEQETGIVSVLTYDGTAGSSARAFSLARLQRGLARAPVKQAVLMLDLSLEPSRGADPSKPPVPRWPQQEGAGDHQGSMVMVGNGALQEAQAYQPGQHGVFTYFLLKGLRGPADRDKNGTVSTGELCDYVQGQVGAVTKAQSGNAQSVLCLPTNGQDSLLHSLPLSKVRER